MSRSPSAYHHGDLRNALLTEATKMARIGGPNAVVLREAARRVGVSPTAAYRHFADQADLLAAVADSARQALAAQMNAALRSVGELSAPTPVALALVRFRVVGRAYIDFSLAEPGLFQTAYAPGLVLPGASPIEARKDPRQDPSYVILSRALDDLAAVGLVADSRRPHAEVAAWAGVHGLATLLHDDVLGAEAANPEALIDATLDMIGVGLLAGV